MSLEDSESTPCRSKHKLAILHAPDDAVNILHLTLARSCREVPTKQVQEILYGRTTVQMFVVIRKQRKQSSDVETEDPNAIFLALACRNQLVKAPGAGGKERDKARQQCRYEGLRQRLLLETRFDAFGSITKRRGQPLHTLQYCIEDAENRRLNLTIVLVQRHGQGKDKIPNNFVTHVYNIVKASCTVSWSPQFGILDDLQAICIYPVGIRMPFSPKRMFEVYNTTSEHWNSNRITSTNRARARRREAKSWDDKWDATTHYRCSKHTRLNRGAL